MKKFIIFIWVICGVVVGACVTNVTYVTHVAQGAFGMLGGQKAYATNVPDEADDANGTNAPQIYIKAINPGYTVDGVSNVGEMIEISRSDKTSNALISLAGVSLSYTNSSGATSVLVEFSEHIWLAGESILLRLASAPEHSLANASYSKTLAMKAGPITLNYNGAVVDSACWTGKEGCAAEFKSSRPTVLVRTDDVGWEHVAVEDYTPTYDENALYEEPSTDDEDGRGAEVTGHCVGLQFSEILSYYAETKDEQFVEIYNGVAEQILLDGCAVKYKNKSYALAGILKPEGYLAVYPAGLGFSLTKNPTNSNVLELVDADGAVVDRLEYYNGQRKGTAWAWIGYDAEGEELWRTTYAPTPGEPNNYQEYRTCEEGKAINEATGNCVKVTTVEEKICAAGQYLNVLTNRCKKYETATEKTCKEGYYLYEETGRCRKITENTGANYSVVAEEYEEGSSFVALYAVLGVVAVGVVYVIYEFRREIRKWWKKMWGKVRGKTGAASEGENARDEG